ncbi:MAG: murein L,D-transpeptidase [Gemmatimonadetes bacterium]|nr:murein L,D-transpeptidase [Gemmatimonadota bacterium]
MAIGPASVGAQLPVLREGSAGEAVALLQVTLSNHEFSAGPSDGAFGPAVRAALSDYQRSRGLKPDGIAGPLVWKDLAGADAGRADAAFRQVAVAPEDTSGLMTIPDSVEAQARLDVLTYETVLERLAERHQTTPRYLRKLNPAVSWPNPPAGTQIRVPAVEFRTTIALEPSASAPGDSAGVKAGVGDARAPLAEPTNADGDPRPWEQRAPAGVTVRVSGAERVVRVYDGERLVARYPATVGSPLYPHPEGEWRIVSQVYAPDYRFDAQYLETGVRSEEALRLPPGPNSIVGILWMGLDKEGYGLHGTNEPESIGKAASHGCVRLANWDVERLARHVGIGTPVTILP